LGGLCLEIVSQKLCRDICIMSESMHPIPEQQWHKQPSVRSTLCRALSISAPIAKCTHHGVTCKVHYHREAIVIQHDHVCFLGLSQSRVSKAETAATGVASAIQLTPGEAVEKWTLALQLDHIVERSSTMQEMSHRLAGDGHHSQAHEHMSLTHQHYASAMHQARKWVCGLQRLEQHRRAVSWKLVNRKCKLLRRRMVGNMQGRW